jgi:hypothetical protein
MKSMWIGYVKVNGCLHVSGIRSMEMKSLRKFLGYDAFFRTAEINEINSLEIS